MQEFYLSLPPIGPYRGWKDRDAKRTAGFEEGKPVVGTYFFYWYDVNTTEHFVNHDGSDALTTHPKNSKGYSYRQPEWHQREMRDIRRAGIDFILPVYWGTPADRSPGKPMYWSIEGLKALVQAQEQMRAQKQNPPPIGMFYDTSTLEHNGAGFHADLRTQAGREWFYVTIRDFFSLVPAHLWARVGDKPIIFLYAAAFAKGVDQAAIDFIYERFQSDFGCKPYLVRETSWNVKSDSVYAWGGALDPKILQVAAIGPGYDHSAVPGRQPLIRDREKGDFYERSWQQILRLDPTRRPWMVLIETWNEFHEGTDIAPSKEYGDHYVKRTAHYAKLFRQGKQVTLSGPFSKAKSVETILLRKPKEAGLKLHLALGGDGDAEPTEIQGEQAWTTRRNRHSENRYLYFQVHDSFYYDSAMPVEIEVEIWDRTDAKPWESGSSGLVVLEYDSTDSVGSVHEGAFKLAAEWRLTDTKQWLKKSVVLSDARFANRANGADFRLRVTGFDLIVRRVRVLKR